MKKLGFIYGSAEEVGVKIQQNYDRMLETTKEWLKIITLDPLPETGLTPKDIVWRKNKTKLYRYANHRGYKYRTPILLLYTFVNKPYLLDLTPEMSLVRHLVDSGFDVYLLDWGIFEWEDRELKFGDIIYDYIARAVRKVCQFSNTEELSILGAGPGGTLASIYAALFPKPLIKNMALLNSPIDYSGSSLYDVWLGAEGFDVDKVTDTFGLIPKDFLMNGFKMIRPVNSYIGNYTRLWRNLDQGKPIDAWKSLNKWQNDNTNFPGEMYRQMLKDFYGENKLVKDELVIKGRIVKLSEINCPLLVISGSKNHLVSTEQAKGILEHVSSTDKTYREFPLGHVGIFFGQMAKKEVFPTVSDWLAERS